jgi:hypothetical protein
MPNGTGSPGGFSVQIVCPVAASIAATWLSDVLT